MLFLGGCTFSLWPHSWLKDLGHTCRLDLVLPWLWCRPEAAAPSLELPYAVGAAVKKKKKKKTWLSLFLGDRTYRLFYTMYMNFSLVILWGRERRLTEYFILMSKNSMSPTTSIKSQ